MPARQCFYWPTFWILALLVLSGFLVGTPLSAEAQPFFVAVSKVNGTPGALWRLEDKNGDRDALDPGEKTVFRDATGAGTLTDDFCDVAVSRSGVVYAIECKSGRVLKFQDLNADGDAQDANEISPLGLAAQPLPLPPLAIEFVAGIEDLGKGSDLLLPDGAPETFTAQVVNQETDKPVPSI